MLRNLLLVFCCFVVVGSLADDSISPPLYTATEFAATIRQETPYNEQTFLSLAPHGKSVYGSGDMLAVATNATIELFAGNTAHNSDWESVLFVAEDTTAHTVVQQVTLSADQSVLFNAYNSEGTVGIVARVRSMEDGSFNATGVSLPLPPQKNITGWTFSVNRQGTRVWAKTYPELRDDAKPYYGCSMTMMAWDEEEQTWEFGYSVAMNYERITDVEEPRHTAVISESGYNVAYINYVDEDLKYQLTLAKFDTRGRFVSDTRYPYSTDDALFDRVQSLAFSSNDQYLVIGCNPASSAEMSIYVHTMADHTLTRLPPAVWYDTERLLNTYVLSVSLNDAGTEIVAHFHAMGYNYAGSFVFEKEWEQDNIFEYVLSDAELNSDAELDGAILGDHFAYDGNGHILIAEFEMTTNSNVRPLTHPRLTWLVGEPKGEDALAWYWWVAIGLASLIVVVAVIVVIAKRYKKQTDDVTAGDLQYEALLVEA
jgi:hypothetical protein